MHSTLFRWGFPAVFLLAFVHAQISAGDKDWRPLFNGKNLDGWQNVNCAPNTFTVKKGMIFCTGLPNGVMRTGKMYENFILEMEWMHEKKNGNAGVFIWSDALPAVGRPFTRSMEVQIMDGREKYDDKGRLLYTCHGDIFSIQGAKLKPDRPHPAGWERCLPSEKRSKAAGLWNHYRLECNDGRIKLAVNGKVVSGVSACNPRKGYICLESEGSPIWFKNLRIKELPTTNPKPSEVAKSAKGFRPLYSGLDLSGWKGQTGHWQAMNWRLRFDGKSQGKPSALWTKDTFGDFQLIVDWRLVRKPKKTPEPIILPRIRLSEKLPAAIRAALTPKIGAGNPAGKWNRFLITMKRERLTVDLNGKRIVANARLADVPKRGPIGLGRQQVPVEFANIFVKELRDAQDTGDGKKTR